MAAKGAAPAAAAAEGAPKKSKKKLLIIIGLVLALAGGGGGYYYMAQKKAKEAAEEDGHPAGKEHAKKPIFVPMDAFTVNLADTNAEKMAQISVTLQISDPKVAEEIKAYMPAIRHNLLKLISSKESKELLSSEGKDRLAEEIAIATALPLGWTPQEEDTEAKPKKAKAGEGDAETKGESDKDSKAKSKKSKRKEPPPNPIEQVHFSQFIVQ